MQKKFLELSYFQWTEKVDNKSHCSEAYNALFMVVVKRKSFDMVEQILKKMEFSRFWGHTYSVCIVIVVSCVKSHKFGEAYQLFLLIQLLYALYLKLWSGSHALAISSDARNRVWGNSAFIHNGLSPDNVTYTSMIGVLCKANRLDEAVNIFEQIDLNRKVLCAYANRHALQGKETWGRFGGLW